MAKETKLFCDRCRKETTRDLWRYVLKLPRKITMRTIYDNGYSIHDFDFDLCKDCKKSFYRFLEGKEDGK